MLARRLPLHTAGTRERSRRRRPWLGRVGILLAVGLVAASEPPWPEFSATTLSGESVSSAALLGSAPTILILTPSRAAAKSTRRWVEALHGRLDPDRYRLRDVIAINLPFFLSESVAVERAREEVPAEYHDETWLVDGTAIERAFDVPRESEEACVIVLGTGGEVASRVHGDVTDRRLDEVVRSARSLLSPP